MEMKTKKVGNNLVIYLEGRLDVNLSAEIEKGINSIISENPESNVCLNLKEIEYMSSSGLRIIVSTMRILKEQNRVLVLCNMNRAVEKIFEVVELTDMFDIFDSEDDALDCLNK